MVVVGIIIIGKAMCIATVERDYWLKVASRLKKDSVDIKPVRGNILSCDGQLMAGSLPEFRLYMDFRAGGEEKDSLWQVKLDSICMGLHEIFPEKSAAKFKEDLEKGRKLRSQHWPIWNGRVSYAVYSEVKSFLCLICLNTRADTMLIRLVHVSARSVRLHRGLSATFTAKKTLPAADLSCLSIQF